MAEDRSAFTIDQPGQRPRFNYDAWHHYRGECFAKYPCQHDSYHKRLDLELAYPVDTMAKSQSAVEHANPTYMKYFGCDTSSSIASVPISRDLFYVCDDWSTIFDVVPAHHPNSEDGWRCIIESCHADPWGEHVGLFCTAAAITDPDAQLFADFRGKFWTATWWQRFNGCGDQYPICIGRYPHKVRGYHELNIAPRAVVCALHNLSHRLNYKIQRCSRQLTAAAHVVTYTLWSADGHRVMLSIEFDSGRVKLDNYTADIGRRMAPQMTVGLDNPDCLELVERYLVAVT